MNKSELISAMAKKSGLTQSEAKKALDAFVESVTESLAKGEKVALAGFGTFELTKVAARTCINPATREKISVPASKKPTMKFGQSYKDSFNK